jgi:SAM-dependent methyltransferase
MTAGTTSEDYNLKYFRHLSDNDEDYSWESPGWRAFFTGAARRTLEISGDVRTVLDVGCAKGLFVMALLDQGADARGFDISAASIADAPEEIRDRVWVSSATEPIAGRYDLVTCIEVFEHLSPEDAERAIDIICACTDKVLMSSTPEDFREPTHINVRTVAEWAAAFAARGFFRRTDIDTCFLTPWAIYLERADPTRRELVHQYETSLQPLRSEVGVKRQALLEASRTIAKLESERESDELLNEERDRYRALEHEVLRLRDHAITCEAMTGTARWERDRAMEVAAAARDELEAVKSSERWRVGGMMLSPVAAVKRRTGH